MNIKTLQLGELNANCYIAVTAPGQCVAFDIGGTPRMLIEYLKMTGLKLNKIFLTHGHYDHIGGVEEVRKATGATVYIHENDAPMLGSAGLSLHSAISIMPFTPVTEYETFRGAENTITDGECTFRVINTPGHSTGSVCYVCEEEKVIFSGDTLFCCSVGRTDFPGGDSHEMMRSLDILNSLEGDYKVYPGHNESTTLDYERQSNPYMRALKK